jgi:alkylhydroperoxidase family enzyme
MGAAIPRLEMDELDPVLAGMLAARVERLGYLGEFFKVCGHQPQSLMAFMQLTDSLKDALSDRLTETVALSVATLCGNAYERHQHERLSEKLGFDRDWILAVTALDPDGGMLAPDEAAAQRLAIEALRDHGHGAAGRLADLVSLVGHAPAIAVLMLVGRYATHALIVNALELPPPVPTIFAPEPEGALAARTLPP